MMAGTSPTSTSAFLPYAPLARRGSPKRAMPTRCAACGCHGERPPLRVSVASRPGRPHRIDHLAIAGGRADDSPASSVCVLLDQDCHVGPTA